MNIRKRGSLEKNTFDGRKTMVRWRTFDGDDICVAK